MSFSDGTPMYKVCDIRDPNLRAGKLPREIWISYAVDLARLIDGSIGSGAPAPSAGQRIANDLKAA